MTDDAPMPDAISGEIISYPRFIFPGEILSTSLDQPLKLGPGLCHISNSSKQTAIMATQAGLLYRRKQQEFYIDYNSHRVTTSSPDKTK